MLKGAQSFVEQKWPQILKPAREIDRQDMLIMLMLISHSNSGLFMYLKLSNESQ